MQQSFWNNTEHAVRLKICNIKNPDVAHNAIQHGVDALGFHMWQAGDVLRRREELHGLVPLFAARVSCWLLTDVQDVELVCTTVQDLGIDTLQIQGTPSPTLIRELRVRLRDRGQDEIRLVKSVGITENLDHEVLEEIAAVCDAILMDTKAYGGTGRENDWELCARVGARLNLPIVIAGGLNEANVVGAMDTVRPYAVDIESGAETVVGHRPDGKRVTVKDFGRVAKLVQLVHGFSASA